MTQPTLAEALAYVEARGREAPVGLGVDVADLKKVMQIIEDCDLRLREGYTYALVAHSLTARRIKRIAKEIRRARRKEKKGG